MFSARHVVLTVKGEHLLTRAWGGSLTHTYVQPYLSERKAVALTKGRTIVMHPYGDESLGRPMNFMVEEVIGGDSFDPDTTTVQIRSTIATNPWLEYYRMFRDSPEFAYIRQKVLDYVNLSGDHYALHVIEQDQH